MPGALAFRSVGLIMHAVFLVPSVVAVPFMRPANASERAGSRIPSPDACRDWPVMLRAEPSRAITRGADAWIA